MSVLFLGHIYPEKVFSVGVRKISRNPIPHQIEPTYESGYDPWSKWYLISEILIQNDQNDQIKILFVVLVFET